MRDFEIKARLRDRDSLVAKAKKLSGSSAKVLVQKDTFYRVVSDRLKLREFANGTGELIHYKRPDTAGPKLSTYTKVEFRDKTACEGIDKILQMLHGHLGVVKKIRHLYIVGQSRIHIDNVEGLGDFMEIEVVLNDDQSVETGEQIIHELMTQLGIDSTDLLSTAYIDMLLNKK